MEKSVFNMGKYSNLSTCTQYGKNWYQDIPNIDFVCWTQHNMTCIDTGLLIWLHISSCFNICDLLHDVLSVLFHICLISGCEIIFYSYGCFHFLWTEFNNIKQQWNRGTSASVLFWIELVFIFNRHSNKTHCTSVTVADKDFSTGKRSFTESERFKAHILKWSKWWTHNNWYRSFNKSQILKQLLIYSQ